MKLSTLIYGIIGLVTVNAHKCIHDEMDHRHETHYGVKYANQ